MNSLFTIAPYWFEGTWVFDDPEVGLKREPFVSGVPAMIDDLVAHIPDADSGFRLTFSANRFPGSEVFYLAKEECGGAWYTKGHKVGWLCPAMFKYLPVAPPSLHVRADAIPKT